MIIIIIALMPHKYTLLCNNIHLILYIFILLYEGIRVYVYVKVKVKVRVLSLDPKLALTTSQFCIIITIL